MVFIRPEPQALWPKYNPNLWYNPSAEFVAGSGEDAGKWQIHNPRASQWLVDHFGINLHARLTNFRHLGFFPEQAVMFHHFTNLQHAKMLNLFAYSGMASLFAGLNGAGVVHGDASPKANGYAKDNFALNQCQNIRILCDDSRKLVAKEIRRGNQYNIILADPPKYGRGPDGEIWDIFTDLPQFLGQIDQILAPGGLFALTIYAIRTAGKAMEQAVKAHIKGDSLYGELAVAEDNPRGFILPQAYSVLMRKY